MIVNIDADCTTESNYLLTIHQHFQAQPESWAAGIRYEHALDDPAIVDYELHLRYYVQAQRHVGMPFAHQTLGSCMVVRSEAYARMGGMNRRKAGEDFYFLQKFIEVGTLQRDLGHHSLSKLSCFRAGTLRHGAGHPPHSGWPGAGDHRPKMPFWFWTKW